MDYARIKEVRVEQDLVDRLVVRVEVPPSALAQGRHHVLLGFDGVLAFYRTENHPHATVPPYRTLPAKWRWPSVLNSVSFRSGPTVRFIEFDAPISREALARLDEFREGGSLHARIEGSVQVLSPKVPERGEASGTSPLWIHGVGDLLSSDPGPAPIALTTETFELHPAKWSDLVLCKLRPPGHFVLEVNASSATGVGEEVLEKYQKARAAFDEGRWDETARLVYIALEGMKAQVANIERAQFVKDQLINRIKAVNALCNRERHRDRSDEEPLRFDRSLAQDALMSAASLMALLYR